MRFPPFRAPAATVDNAAFSSGNKVLHNVVGKPGVVEGGGGDLRAGLRLQSAHDGHRFVHEPLRLSVYIEAPRTAIARVLERHEPIRRPVEHGWLHLFALEEKGHVIVRRTARGCWEDVSA